MVGDINGERRDARSRLSWRPPRLRLSDLLTAMAVVAVAVLPSTHGQCAAIGPLCYCGGWGLECKDLGIVPQVPPFRASNYTIHTIWIGGNTTMATVQTNAFIDVVTTEIIMSNIGITTIEPGAFSGLEKYLSYLELRGNLLETLHDSTFRGFYGLVGM